METSFLSSDTLMLRIVLLLLLILGSRAAKSTSVSQIAESRAVSSTSAKLP